jgi:hypothetical protein
MTSGGVINSAIGPNPVASPVFLNVISREKLSFMNTSPGEDKVIEGIGPGLALTVAIGRAIRQNRVTSEKIIMCDQIFLERNIGIFPYLSWNIYYHVIKGTYWRQSPLGCSIEKLIMPFVAL